MEKVFATIITIGDELLIGQVIDTNSSWIAQEFITNGNDCCKNFFHTLVPLNFSAR